MTGDDWRVRSLLSKNQPAFGVWSILNSPSCSEIMASAGLDFLILDNEHGTYSYSELENNIRAVFGYCTDVFVRVSSLDPIEIQKVLDLGIQGILVPQIKTADDVRRVVGATRLAPLGRRGFNPFTRAGNYRGNATSRFFRHDDLMVGILIETLEAIDDLDAILAVEGLGLIYIGVYDLSCVLGVPGQVSHPLVLSALERVSSKALQAGIEVGLMVSSREAALPFIEGGVRFLVFRPDTTLFFETIQSLVR